MSIYGFEIPHHKVRPCRDYISIQIPLPPRKVGHILTPDNWREVSQHNVQAGIIRAMGPLGFHYRIDNQSKVHEAKLGDWVLIRWGAGTMFTANRGVTGITGGWRYITTFNDVIGIVDAADMPNPETLEWDEDDDVSQIDMPLEEEVGVRERVVYGAGNGR